MPELLTIEMIQNMIVMMHELVGNCRHYAEYKILCGVVTNTGQPRSQEQDHSAFYKINKAYAIFSFQKV